MKKPLPISWTIKNLRNDLKMTQRALAKKAKISIQYVRAIEGGYNCSDDVKRKLAAALGYSVWALFPEVKSEVDLYKVLLSRYGRELVIRDDQIPMFKEVLSRMSQEEFGELIRSGWLGEDVHRMVQDFAKDHDIEVIG